MPPQRKMIFIEARGWNWMHIQYNEDVIIKEEGKITSGDNNISILCDKKKYWWSDTGINESAKPYAW